ncbi:MAG: 50S ribosomal protein L31 [Dehalococcoidia bacterium]|nr:50S ribosomal protein L31 [Dehalococcoidia bacterium]MAX03847.1 50S ribosomal protein L31 [Dehalococcoidia bacterium]|tara:strand:- start:1808 stop:2011 length:204 start_codon:yes stop_codon:yes gene_type:complete
MKQEIHPEYYSQAKVVCSCGEVFTTGSTKAELKVELCNKCHPFYTGEQRIVDTEGRVDRMKRRYNLN